MRRRGTVSLRDSPPGNTPAWFTRVRSEAQGGKLVMLDLARPGAKHKVMVFMADGKVMLYNPSGGKVLELRSPKAAA